MVAFPTVATLAVLGLALLATPVLAVTPDDAAGEDPPSVTVCKMASGRRVCVAVLDPWCTIYVSAGPGGCFFRL